MFKMVTKILGVIALTGWMGAANATLIFDFSWDSDNGKIIGEIYGLSDNGYNLEASGLVLTSVGGLQVSIDVFNGPLWDVEYNSFYVFDGKVVGAVFVSTVSFPDNYFFIDCRDLERDCYVNYIGPGIDYGDDGISVVKRVTVPEPSSVILMLLGLAGLSFARYRKQY
jgi:hypothetical protein